MLQYLGENNIFPIRVVRDSFVLIIEKLVVELPEIINTAKTNYRNKQNEAQALAPGGELWLQDRDNTEIQDILIDTHQDICLTSPEPCELAPLATTFDARLIWYRYIHHRYIQRIEARGIFTIHRESQASGYSHSDSE